MASKRKQQGDDESVPESETEQQEQPQTQEPPTEQPQTQEPPTEQPQTQEPPAERPVVCAEVSPEAKARATFLLEQYFGDQLTYKLSPDEMVDALARGLTVVVMRLPLRLQVTDRQMDEFGSSAVMDLRSQLLSEGLIR